MYLNFVFQDNENCCLNLIYNQNVDHYISWAPYGGQSVRDTEIGINALVAQEIGNISKNKSVNVLNKKINCVYVVYVPKQKIEILCVRRVKTALFNSDAYKHITIYYASICIIYKYIWHN